MRMSLSTLETGCFPSAGVSSSTIKPAAGNFYKQATALRQPQRTPTVIVWTEPQHTQIDDACVRFEKARVACCRVFELSRMMDALIQPTQPTRPKVDLQEHSRHQTVRGLVFMYEET